MFRQRMLRGCCLSLFLSSLVTSGCYSESSDQLSFDEGDVLLEEELSKVADDGSAVVAGSTQASSLLNGGSDPVVHSLVKRVTQTLSQSSPDGLETSQAQLAAWFDVRVEMIGGGDCSYRVSYRRISYSHKLPGEKLSYDSSDKSNPPPAALAHLAELSRSGFVFRTTGGGKSLVLTEVPASVFGGDREGSAASEFISDQIGVVVLGRGEGESRVAPLPRTRHISSPVPMDFSTRYSIKGTGQGTVTLDMLGSVSSVPGTTQVQLVGGAATVKLGGGHAFGEMTIDSNNGVPVRADWNRYIEISLRTESDERIEQRKHEVVTIRTVVETPAAVLPIDASVATPLQPAGTTP